MHRRSFMQSSVAAGITATGGQGAQVPPASSRRRFNETIEASWKAGLDVLKPTEKDLAHGLELHAQSIVFDSYGFSPTSALDVPAFAAAINAGASDNELQDLDEDTRMTRHVLDAQERAEYLEAWDASGVTCVFQNAGEEGSVPLRLLKRLARFTYTTDFLRDLVFKAVDPDDIEAAKKQGKRCLYLTGNGIPLAGDCQTAEEELRYVRVFYELGIRMMHVTYNRRNVLADGCAETSNGGLSDLGRSAIAELNRVGVIVDVAHSGWRTSLEAARVSKKPIVASHSGCNAISEHIRNKPDDVIRAIVDGGGLLGVYCIPSFLGLSGDIVAMLDHIQHIVKRFGVEHVAIGTDIGYRSRRAQVEGEKLPRRGRRRTRYEAFWPLGSIMAGDVARQKFPGSPSLAWTNWPLFTVGLVQRGYNDRDIQKILGQNMLRVSRHVMSDRRPALEKR